MRKSHIIEHGRLRDIAAVFFDKLTFVFRGVDILSGALEMSEQTVKRRFVRLRRDETTEAACANEIEKPRYSKTKNHT